MFSFICKHLTLRKIIVAYRKHSLIKFLFILLFSLYFFTVNAGCSHVKRIVTLAPNLTELVFSVGAGKQLVGVDTASNYPPAAKKITKIASYRGLDLERIVKLHPDLILAWRGGNPPAQLAQLHRLGFRVEQFSLLRLQQIPHALRRVGCYSGHQKQANHLAQQFTDRVKKIRRLNQAKKKVHVFIELSASPLQTLSRSSLVNDMIKTCAGRNIFADLIGSAPRVSVESVLQLRPQAMFSTMRHWKNNWQKWHQIPAVRFNNLFTLNPDVLYRATFRSLQGLKAVCHALDLARSRSSV